MSLAFDEFGRPFIIIREQEKKKRTKGMEAHKVSSSRKYSLRSFTIRPIIGKSDANEASLTEIIAGRVCERS